MALDKYIPQHIANQFNTVYDLLDAFDRNVQGSMLGYPKNWGKRLISSIASEESSYPPFNLFMTCENQYVIQIACAGFSKDEISVSTEKDVLKISAQHLEQKEGMIEDGIIGDEQWFHRGIANRKFSRSFFVAPNVHVKTAEYKDGILTVKLEHIVPEEELPKSIRILEGGK